MKEETVEIVDEHGEVHEHVVKVEAPRRGRRPARELTPEEQETKREREAYRRTKFQVLEALCPALAVEADHMAGHLDDLIDTTKARDVGTLLRLPRKSGQGWPGSSLVLARREYLGGTGGDARTYLLLFVEAVDRGAHRYRAGRGVTLNADDLRPVAKVLTELADALDAEGADEPA